MQGRLDPYMIRDYTKSYLYQRIDDGTANISQDMHMIGDLDKLSHRMLVGFKYSERLNILQRNFN